MNLKAIILLIIMKKLINSLPWPEGEEEPKVEEETTSVPTTLVPETSSIIPTTVKPSQNYSYNDKLDNGPSNWTGLCATGLRQSPIAYDQAKYEKKVVRPTIIMSGAYQKRPDKVRLFNNGQGIAVSFIFSNDSIPKITGGPLGNETYVFDSFHYHTPCEHQFVLNSQACVLELHMVHFNEKYETFENSTDKDDGLAVVGILYISTYTETLQTLPFVPMLKNIIEPNSEYFEDDPEKAFSYFDVVHMMSVPRVVSYKGSMTFPNCSEGVTWVILASPNLVLESDMRQIREIKDVDGNRILRNNRPTQPLNGRKVYLYAAF
ncbi:hypothetical protein ACKWTF_013645 [Chironomus riparius]